MVARRHRQPPLAVRFALRALLLAVVVGIVYVGYAQLRDAAPDAARTLSDPPVVVPEDDPTPPIAEALVSLATLPSGWAVQTYDPTGDDICEGRVPRSVMIPRETASSSFNRGLGGPFLTNVITRHEDAAGAQRYLDLVVDTLTACRTQEVDGTTLVLEPLDFPRFGDDTFAVTLKGESTAGQVTGTVIYLRVDDRVAQLATIAFDGPDVEKELIELLARLVQGRLD